MKLSTIPALFPAWLIGLAAIVLVTIVTLAIHAVVSRRVIAAAERRNPLLARFLNNNRLAIRLAIVVVALWVFVAISPLAEAPTRYVSGAITVAFIGLIAWIVVTFIDVTARLQLGRFQLDVEDNLLARKQATQIRIFRRTGQILVILIAIAAALMSFETVRQYGVSLLAAGGAAGIVLGFAAQPLLSNLLAGIQLALTQPIRIDDAVVVEGEWGWIEEITATYVVIRIWDLRRLIVPLRYFIEQPFQNWTREEAAIIGSVFLHVDYTVPVEAVREQLNQIVKETKLWNGKVVNLQVTDTGEKTITLRALVSARNSPEAWDLRCLVRERLVAWLQAHHPDALPRFRAEIDGPDGDPAPRPGPAG